MTSYVSGVTTKVNIMSIHDNGKLVHYCGLRLGYGYLAHIMKRTDEKRWMKRARYPCQCIQKGARGGGGGEIERER